MIEAPKKLPTPVFPPIMADYQRYRDQQCSDADRQTHPSFDHCNLV
jgi:hypothetical protein